MSEPTSETTYEAASTIAHEFFVTPFINAATRFGRPNSIKGGNRFKKGVFLMIFMIFFDNKGMNIIYLYFVNILYIYLRINCEIFKFFFEKHGR